MAELATTYIRTRSLGIIAGLCILTCSGIYRGFKDTRTPLYASAATAATSLLLNILLIYGEPAPIIPNARCISKFQGVFLFA